MAEPGLPGDSQVRKNPYSPIRVKQKVTRKKRPWWRRMILDPRIIAAGLSFVAAFVELVRSLIDVFNQR